jgi:protein O-GlcNAc transferase
VGCCMKTGRNAPCTCGSGKKYKFCCGQLVEKNPSKKIEGALNISWSMSQAWKEYESGNFNVAITIYRKILRQQPRYADAHHHLGIALCGYGDHKGAIVAIQRAIQLNPDNAHYYNSLGFVYAETRNPCQAIVNLNKTLAMEPDFALAYINRAKAHIDQQMTEAAIADYKMAAAIQPDLTIAHENLLYALNFTNKYSCEDIFKQHEYFGSRYAESFLVGRKLACDNLKPDRRLKIGYVSADFRMHSVAYFIGPVLENHDHDHYELFAFYNNSRVDSVTQKFRKCFDYWFNIRNLSDDDLENLIKQHEIDILVDLSGHTAHSRVLIFARKPAPIQLTWIGYPNTTCWV